MQYFYDIYLGTAALAFLGFKVIGSYYSSKDGKMMPGLNSAFVTQKDIYLIVIEREIGRLHHYLLDRYSIRISMIPF